MNLFFVLLIILLAAKLGAEICVRIGQPAVLGEILAGVVLGLLTPAWSFYDPRDFAGAARSLVGAAGQTHEDGVMTDAEYEFSQATLEDLHRLVTETQSPLERLEHLLQRWVAFVIVPLFAFSNAGVRLTSDALDGIATDPVVLGVALGLLAGKTVGVFTFTWVGDRLGLGNLPSGIDFRHVFGLGVTAGIGFTVALFVTGLAFDPGSAVTDSAKIGILAGSLVSGILGYTVLKTGPDPAPQDGNAPSAGVTSVTGVVTDSLRM